MSTKSFLPKQLDLAADQVINIQKSLEFLRFEMEREKFRTENVFKDEAMGTKPSPTPGAKPHDGVAQFEELRIAWKQSGDFWRAERLDYRAIVTNQCKKPNL